MLNISLDAQALKVYLSLPVGLSVADLEKRQDAISYALGGNVKITQNGRAVLLTRQLNNLPNLLPYDARPDLSKYQIPWWLGVSSSGPVILDLAVDETYGLIGGGLSGMGKTTSISTLVDCQEGKTKSDLIISACDLKGVDFPDYEKHPLFENLAYDPEEIKPITGWLLNEIDERKRLFKEVGVRDIAHYPGRLPRHLLIIDEYTDILDLPQKLSAPIQQDLYALLRRGRSFGVHCVFFSHRLTHREISTSLRNMFPCSVCFRCTKREDSEVILGIPDAKDLPDIKGRAILRRGNEYMTIQTPYFEHQNQS